MLRRYLVLSMLALALVVAARGVLTALLQDGQNWGWLSVELIQGAGVAALYLMMLGNAFGYLLLSREKEQGEHAGSSGYPAVGQGWPGHGACSRRTFEGAGP